MAKLQRKKQHEASKFELFRASQSQNISRYYQLFFRSVVMIGVCFLIAGLVFRPTETFQDYALNTPLSTNQIGLSVSEKYVNAAENKVYLRVVIHPSSEGQALKHATLSFKVKLKGASSSDVTFQMFKGSNYYYDVVISAIPDTWQSLKLFASADDFNSDVSFTFGRHAEKEAYKRLKESAIFSTEVAQVRAIQEEISRVNAMIETTIPSQIVANHAEILKVEQEMSSLEADKKFQTEAEIKRTDMELSQYHNSLFSLRQGIEKLKQQQKEQEEKAMLLTQKMAEVAGKNGVDLEQLSVE